MDEQFRTRGAFSWVELMTNDPKSAVDFYTKLFGWSTEEMHNTPGVDYTVVKVAGKPIGGIMSMPPGTESMPPNWGAYVTVDDVDAVAEPKDIPNVGRFCVIQDSQGAVISAITYASA